MEIKGDQAMRRPSGLGLWLFYAYLGGIVAFLVGGNASAPAQTPSEYVWLTEECPLEFNVSGRVELPPPTSPPAQAQVVVSYRSPDDHRVVAFEDPELKGWKVEGGQITPLWPPRPLSPAPVHSFVIKRRAHRLAVVVDGKLIGQAMDETESGGSVGSREAGGIQFDALSIQEVEPVYFTDDFMRTADQLGVWEPICGKWKVKVVDSVEPDPARSANPFSFGVTAPERAVAVAGYGFWDSYLYQVAVKPEAPGAVGLVAFYQDPQNYVLFR
jgi:hypothetical protein